MQGSDFFLRRALPFNGERKNVEKCSLKYADKVNIFISVECRRIIIEIQNLKIS